MYYATLAIIMHIMLTSHSLSACTLNFLLMHTSLTPVSCVAALSSFSTGPPFPDVADHLEVLDCHNLPLTCTKYQTVCGRFVMQKSGFSPQPFKCAQRKQSNVNIFTPLKPENCNYLICKPIC